MKSFSFRLLGAVVAVGVIAGSAQASNIYMELATAPVQLDAVTAHDASEIGAWEYVYDVIMDNEGQFDEFQLNDYDWDAGLVNRNSTGHSGTTGIHTQKWDGYSQSSGIKSWDNSNYGSYNSGGVWHDKDGAGGVYIANSWHSIGDYQGTSSWAGVDPKFITDGHLTTDTNSGTNTALRYVNSVTTGTNYNGLVVTLRLLSMDGPAADAVEFRAYSFNGATVYTNSVTGPSAGGGGGGGGGAVPEPSTLAMLGVALLGLCGFIRRRNG